MQKTSLLCWYWYHINDFSSSYIKNLLKGLCLMNLNMLCVFSFFFVFFYFLLSKQGPLQTFTLDNVGKSSNWTHIFQTLNNERRMDKRLITFLSYPGGGTPHFFITKVAIALLIINVLEWFLYLLLYIFWVVSFFFCALASGNYHLVDCLRIWFFVFSSAKFLLHY